MDKYQILDSLGINIDQISTKHVRVSWWTLVNECDKSDAIKKGIAKRSITTTFAITFSGKLLPMQVIYGGKTSKPPPRFKFPSSFSLSYNITYYSNDREQCNLIEEILVSDIKKMLQNCVPLDQWALVILDVLPGQIKTTVLDCFKENDIEVVCVPVNMTNLL